MKSYLTAKESFQILGNSRIDSHLKVSKTS